MKFFSDVKNSIYNPDYYQSLITSPFLKSLKYFLVLTLCLALLTAGCLSFSLIPNLKLGIDQLKSGLLQSYPDNLEIYIKKGTVSTNVKEPYFIKMPAGSGLEKKNPGYENVLVIDTINDFSLEQFKNYKTFCWLSRESVSCYNNNGSIKITNLATMPDFSFSKSTITNFIQKVSPFLSFIYPALIILLFVAIFMGYVLGYIIYLLFAAFLIWLVAKLRKVKIGYKKSYQLGLHLLTLPLLINVIINAVSYMFEIRIYTFSLFFTAVLVIISFLNLKHQEVAMVMPQS